MECTFHVKGAWRRPEHEVIRKGWLMQEARCLHCGYRWLRRDRLAPVTMPKPHGSGEAPETLEQFGERIASAVRRQFMDTLDDDVIGRLGSSHVIFGKACAMEAIATAMRESAAANLLNKHERERGRL